MKNSVLLLIISIIFIGNCQAQDVIYKKDNTKINCKVTKINESTIDYKKASQPNGPLREISISKVHQIIYGDGSFEIFKLEPKTTPLVNTSKSLTLKHEDIFEEYNNTIDKSEVFIKINNKRNREKIRKFNSKVWMDKDKKGIAIEKVIGFFKNGFNINGFAQELSEENSKFILTIDISEIYYILNNVLSPVTIEQMIAIDIALIEKHTQKTLYQKSSKSTSNSKMKALKKDLKSEGLQIKTFKVSTTYNIFSVSTHDLVNKLCLDPKFQKYFNH